MIRIEDIDGNTFEVEADQIVGLSLLSAFNVDVVLADGNRIIVEGRLEEVKANFEDQGVNFPVDWDTE